MAPGHMLDMRVGKQSSQGWMLCRLKNKLWPQARPCAYSFGTSCLSAKNELLLTNKNTDTQSQTLDCNRSYTSFFKVTLWYPKWRSLKPWKRSLIGPNEVTLKNLVGVSQTSKTLQMLYYVTEANWFWERVFLENLDQKSLHASRLSSVQNSSDIPLYRLVYRHPYIGFL